MKKLCSRTNMNLKHEYVFSMFHKSPRTEKCMCHNLFPEISKHNSPSGRGL